MMMCVLWVCCTHLCTQPHEGMSPKSAPGSFPKPAFPVHATLWVSMLRGENEAYVLFSQTAARRVYTKDHNDHFSVLKVVNI